MRLIIALPLAAMALAAAPAKAQLYVTGVTATFPDPNGKVPAFNAVPGAGIPTVSNGFAQAVLTHGQSYNYCVTLASADTQGKAQVGFSLKRGATVIQSHVIVKEANYAVSPNGVWLYCSGYLAVPDSPGKATLTGSVIYLANGSKKSVTSRVSVAVVIE
jgi:uncharacterized protein GlcG (DUF336 family)